MDVTYFGHNTFLVMQNETSILIDPWFSPNGAFFGSWFHCVVASHREWESND